MIHDPNHPSFMSETRQRRSNPAGDLPAEFDRHLVDLDQKLSRHAGEQSVPQGLAERVYRASVSLLPGRYEDAPLRLPRSVRTPVWGQLAMAASVALAFGIAMWFHSSSVITQELAMDEAHVQPATPETVATTMPHRPASSPDRSILLSSEALRVLFDGGSDYLLDTRDMTHAEAIADLHRLYEHLSEL